MARKNSRRGGSGVTIHDVARHAGVSPMTVSRVINTESNVRETTRAKVAAAIKTLHYAPNMAARSLAGAETVRIGLLYSNPSAAYLSELLLGSLAQSSLSGCQLVVEQCDETSVDAIARLAAGGVRGVVLPPPLCDDAAALEAVAKAGIAAVLVASGRPHPAFSAVSIDDFEAARAMTRHLLGLGHRRIAFINGHPNQTASGQRFRGFIEGMTEAGLSVATHQVAQGYFTYRSGLAAAEKLLDGNFHPTAIFASNDDMAAAAMAVAHRRGLDVPGDLMVAGFDDTALATAVWPSLTTVRQPISNMARDAILLLLAQVRGARTADAPPPVTHRRLKHALVTRESTGTPAAPGES
jgi:LacI family transcriptional regulator